MIGPSRDREQPSNWYSDIELSEEDFARLRASYHGNLTDRAAACHGPGRRDMHEGNTHGPLGHPRPLDQGDELHTHENWALQLSPQERRAANLGPHGNLFNQYVPCHDTGDQGSNGPRTGERFDEYEARQNLHPPNTDQMWPLTDFAQTHSTR